MSTTGKLKDLLSELFAPNGGKVDGLLEKLSAESIKLNDLMGIVRVIDRDYRKPVAAPHPSGGFFPPDVAFGSVLGDMAATKELQLHLLDCVKRLKESRPDLAERCSRLFS
jgi:hypothetical protein